MKFGLTKLAGCSLPSRVLLSGILRFDTNTRQKIGFFQLQKFQDFPRASLSPNVEF